MGTPRKIEKVLKSTPTIEGAGVDLKRAFGRPIFVWLIGVASVFLPLPCQAQTPPAYIITTVAGSGTLGFAGDAGPATGALLGSPSGVAVDTDGNLYIADQFNHRIRRVVADGTISTVAGNGTGGYTGDGGQGGSAELHYPFGVAVNLAGSFYIADGANNVVRKVAQSGTISTVAGNNTAGAGFAGDGGAATSAQLHTPLGVAVDAAGNLYIADTGNNVIRKVGSDGTITTVAGDKTAAAGYSDDGGPATIAKLNYPYRVTVDAAGNLYIADTGNNVIREVTVDGTIMTVAGNGAYGFGYSGDGGPAKFAQLNHPVDVAVDAAGYIYIADCFNSRTRKVAADGTITTVAGTGRFRYTGDGGPATKATFYFLTGLAVDAAGNLYVADSQNNVIRKLTPVPPAIPEGPPSINSGGVNGASAFGAFSSIAPGSWIEIYGTNLAATSRAWTISDFNGVYAPIWLDGTTVTVGGQPAFIAYVSPGFLVVQVPSNISAGASKIVVTTGAGTSTPCYVFVHATWPGLFAPSSFNIGGRQYVGAVFPDGVTFVLPSGAIPGIPSRPARPGEIIVIFGVGFGSVNPNIPAGQIVQQLNALTLSSEISIGGTPATLQYAGLAPTVIGLYQFNVIVPNVGSGDALPLTFTLNGASGNQTLFTAVQN